MVYLAGKDEQGKTIYIEEDGMTHQHKYKGKEQGQPSMQSTTSAATTTLTTDSTALKIINAKLDRIINILEPNQKAIVIS